MAVMIIGPQAAKLTDKEGRCAVARNDPDKATFDLRMQILTDIFKESHVITVSAQGLYETLPRDDHYHFRNSLECKDKLTNFVKAAVWLAVESLATVVLVEEEGCLLAWARRACQFSCGCLVSSELLQSTPAGMSIL